MMLHLGVMDVAYSEKDGKKTETKTTGEVAEILEAKYDVMGTFYELYKEEIADIMAKEMANRLESLDHGAPISMMSEMIFPKIEHLFRKFLESGEMERLLSSLSPEELEAMGPKAVFTGAGKRGVSHRKKHPYSKKNKARPAFIDTGQYMRSFRAWLSNQ